MTLISLQQVSAVELHPIALEEAKSYLKIDFDFDDHLLENLIASVTSDCEKFTGISLTKKTWRTTFAVEYGKAEIILPRRPVMKILNVKSYYQSDCSYEVPRALYYCHANRLNFKVFPSYDLVDVNFEAGFEVDSQDEEFLRLRSDLLMDIAERYQERCCFSKLSEKRYAKFKEVRI